jgi:hypothetical protein
VVAGWRRVVGAVPGSELMSVACPNISGDTSGAVAQHCRTI